MTVPPINFLEPWVALHDNAADHFLRELRLEASRDHPLHGLKLIPVGRSLQADDVLFAMEDGCVVDVHLTWTNKTERPPCPIHRIYSSAEQWAERVMLPLHAES